MQNSNFDNNPRYTRSNIKPPNPTVRTTFSPVMYAALVKYKEDSGMNNEADVIRMFCSALLKKAGYLSGNV